MTDPIPALLRDLDAGLWITLAALADAHEERGEVKLARAYRWLARNKRQPFQIGSARKPVLYWQVGKSPTTRGGLPEKKFLRSALEVRSEHRDGNEHRAYATLADAYRAAAEAWIG